MLDDDPARGLRQGADAADGPLSEPARRLPRAARTYWGAELALQGAAVVVAALVLVGVFDGPAAIVVAVLAVAVTAVVAVPPLRWRTWRYEIRNEEIDLVHGTLVRRRTVVPIRRVQHVETQSGPLQGRFGLAAVTFHTAAGAVEIPALLVGEAGAVRTRVADRARALDDV